MAARERAPPVDDWAGFTSYLESVCLSGPLTTLVAMRDELQAARASGTG